MEEKEYHVDNLEREARLAWILDDDPEPDVRVYVKDGKVGVFITITSDWQGYATRRCLSVGEPFTYDEAYVLAFDPRSLCCMPAQSCLFALGQNGRTTIYAVEAYEAKPIIKDAVSMEDAINQFGERIGLKYTPWENLLTPPSPTWEKLDYTPEHIISLEPHQIFVFGSNREGKHIGGAAKVAFEHFGAIWGQGEGLQGQSYALPTMGLSLDEIQKHIETFLHCAYAHPELEFLVTRIGCGIAGFKERDIAPLFLTDFSLYMELHNVTMPESFADIISCILNNERY